MNIKKTIFIKISILACLIVLVVFGKTTVINHSSSQLLNKIKAENVLPKETPEHVLTVFIHGTILPLPSFTTFGKTIKGETDKSKRIKGSFYTKYIRNLRFAGIHKFQPINKLGLIKLDIDHPTKIDKFACKIANLYKAVYQNANSDKKNTLDFYTFGWDGALDKKKRLFYAKELYTELQKEIATIKKNDKSAKITIQILAHSHGGNVALNLANVENELKQNLRIDSLVLLATPIQSETEDFIYSDVFKKIYSLYSTGDVVQIADVISTKDSQSKRQFFPKNNLQLPPKLTQIRIKVENKNPLHNEFWLMGGNKNLIYRGSLAIYPFPLAIFIPLIINLVEKEIQNSGNLKLIVTKNTDLYEFTFDNTKTSSNTLTSINSKELKSLIDGK